MIGILVALAISWLLLYFVEKKSIAVLGVVPTVRNMTQFLTGFLITAVLCVGTQYLDKILRGSVWTMNDWQRVAGMLWWDFKSVLMEELMFRGALLYILIRKIGPSKAILISAAAFGVLHWFSFGVLGNVIPMLFIFAGTGMMGYAWALAFAKTRSIMMPLGFHLGWNMLHNTIFSMGPLGAGLISSSGGIQIANWFSLIGLLGVPVIVILFVRYVQKESPSS